MNKSISHPIEILNLTKFPFGPTKDEINVLNDNKTVTSITIKL